MQDPEAYLRGNHLQLKETQELLSNYFHLIQWKKEGQEVVMDLGCGPGSTTWNVLKAMLPTNCETILAVDIQERMVEFGRENYASINFVKSDIGSAEFVTRFKNSVDHVFYLFFAFIVLEIKGNYLHTYIKTKNLIDVFYLTKIWLIYHSNANCQKTIEVFHNNQV